jgi:hypothetical protein
MFLSSLSHAVVLSRDRAVKGACFYARAVHTPALLLEITGLGPASVGAAAV